MNKRVLIVVGVLAALLLVFMVGVVVAGGVVFAAAQMDSFSHQEVIVPRQIDRERGILISSVVSDGPAASAGIVRGDILLTINAEAVNHPQDLVRYLGDSQSGDEVVLAVLHGDEERTLTAILGERNGRPYLGVVPCGGLPLEEHILTPEAMIGPGVVVLEVVPGSPADEAGLEAGDLIVSVDGKELDAENDLAGLIADYAPGDGVSLEVKSPGEEPREVTVTLGGHPEEEATAFLGVRYAPAPHIDGMHRFEGVPMPFEERPFHLPPFEDEHRFFLPGGNFEQAAVVRGVASDSPAEAAGLKRGDVITAIDGEPVAGPEAVVYAIGEHKPGEEVTLTVSRPENQEEFEVQATLGEHPDKEGEAYLGVRVGVFIRMQKQFDGDRVVPDRLKDLERRFRFRLPSDEVEFDFQVEPPNFDFKMFPDDCCDDEPSEV